MQGTSAFVLAGGKSSRMGTDKAFLKWNGQSLLQRALALGASVAEEVFIAGDPARFSPYGRVVGDIFPEHGPLGAIHAALRATGKEWNLMLAVDMPLVESGLLSFLFEVARQSDAVVTVPRLAGGWQPLCAVYRPAFADQAEQALGAGRNKVDALFSQVQVRAVEEEELRQAGFQEALFRNLNTPEEFRRAGEEAGQETRKRE
ncbi:MAG: molybdenum cofactor guanylyltransferase [Acidobacteria bacterium]|nr:molybdenum cofactor guanylyltransferase [Acidobacteriota bacterium]